METLQAGPSARTPLTASGARIEPIASEEVRTLVGRYGTVNESATVLDDVWGAFEHRRTLIGIAYLISSRSSAGRGGVAVVPERRGLGVGRDLMRLLVNEAWTRGMRTLAYEHAASDSSSPRLIASLGLTVARRVHDGRALTIVIVPHPPFRYHQGEP